MLCPGHRRVHGQCRGRSHLLQSWLSDPRPLPARGVAADVHQCVQTSAPKGAVEDRPNQGQVASVARQHPGGQVDAAAEYTQ